MGNCLQSCFGRVKTKRVDYFSGRFNNSSIDIEFENLIEDDDVERNHAVLTDDERNLLLNRRYTDLVQEQQRVDAKLDKELALEEENARLEEEAYNAARQEAARAAKKARLLEAEKQRNKTQQSNGSAKGWLGEDAGDWEIATEDDFEAFLDTVKAKSETVRASVASMLNTKTTTATTSSPFQSTSPSNQSTSPPSQFTGPSSQFNGLASQFSSPVVTTLSSSNSIKHQGHSTPAQSAMPVPQNTTTPVVSHSTATPNKSATPSATPSATVSQPSTHSPQFNSLKTQGGRLSSVDEGGPNTQGLVDGFGQMNGSGLVEGSGQEIVSNMPDVTQEASQRDVGGNIQNDEGLEKEGSGKMSYYIKPESSHHHGDSDSDVEWEADFVSADSPSEPITITPQSSPAKITPTIPTTHQPITTGLPSNSRTNGSALANGQLPYKHDPEKEIEVDDKTLSNAGKSSVAVKAKKTLDIDIDKFLEELDFDT